MRLFSRRHDIATTPVPPEATLGSADTLPATAANWKDRVRVGGHEALGTATRYYKQHPKLIGGLAVLAGALLLNRMKRPH